MSRSIHVVANGVISSFYVSNIPLCSMHHTSFTHSSADGRIGRFHVLAVVNSAAVNSRLRASFQTIIFSGYMPRSGFAGLHGNSIFSF